MSLPETSVKHDWSWAFGPSIGAKDEFRAIPGLQGMRIARDGRICRDVPVSLDNGYWVVGIPKDWTRKVHHLVLETYVGPRPPGLLGCHNDGNTSNNHVENLRWDTHKSNAQDRRKHGTQVEGTKDRRAKLTEFDIPHICNGYQAGCSAIDIARAYGVSDTTIRDILTFKDWVHVPREPIPLRGRTRRHAKSTYKLPDLRGSEEDGRRDRAGHGAQEDRSPRTGHTPIAPQGSRREAQEKIQS